jgi:gas vesicle protein GvpL/GvpF
MTSDVHVYGLIAADDACRLPAGVRRIVHGDLAAVVSDSDGAPVRAATALREHWSILEQVVRETTVLPIRFGTVMEGDDAVVAHFLAPAHDGLRAGLDELSGKVQVTVKGTYEEDVMLREVVSRSSTIARLKAEVDALPEAASYAKRIQLGELVSAEVERQRERDTALVVERLEPHAVASRAEGASGLDGAVNVAFLVERDRIAAFEAAAATLARDLGGRISLRSIGPLPAYSFTPEGASAWG